MTVARELSSHVPTAIQRRRRLRLARTLVGGSVRRALLPPGSARGRERVQVCRAANMLSALGVRVEVVGGAVPWPRSERLVVSDHTGWLGDLALSTAVPRTPVISRARALTAGAVVCRWWSATGRPPGTSAGTTSRRRRRRWRPCATWSSRCTVCRRWSRFRAHRPWSPPRPDRPPRRDRSRIPVGAAILRSATNKKTIERQSQYMHVNPGMAGAAFGAPRPGGDGAAPSPPGSAQSSGLSCTFTTPSVFSWNLRYISGASDSGTRCVANVSQPSGSPSVSSGMISGIQRLMLH